MTASKGKGQGLKGGIRGISGDWLPKEMRICLGCGKPFLSKSVGNRRCSACKRNNPGRGVEVHPLIKNSRRVGGS